MTNVIEVQIQKVDTQGKQNLSEIGRQMAHDWLQSVFVDYKFQIVNTADGRPYVDTNKIPKFCWNISHDDSLVAFVGDIRYDSIGLDVCKVDLKVAGQDVEFIDQLLSVMSYALSDDEIKYLKSTESDDERLHQFCIIWSLKEAYLKAIGTGIREELSHLSTVDKNLEIKQFIGDYQMISTSYENYSISVAVKSNTEIKLLFNKISIK